MVDRISGAFRFNEQVLALRHERQKVLASNIANADTPQYKARDLDFRSALDRAMSKAESKTQDGLRLNTTSVKHIQAQALETSNSGAMKYRSAMQPSLDGNTVDMDVERAEFADNSVRYQAAISFLNGQIRGLRTAMQPE